MKAIGVDCWILPEQERINCGDLIQDKVTEYLSKAGSSRLPEEAKQKIKVISQNELQNALQQLASELSKQGYQTILADPNRFRVLVPDEQVNDLQEKINKMVQNIWFFSRICG